MLLFFTIVSCWHFGCVCLRAGFVFVHGTCCCWLFYCLQERFLDCRLFSLCFSCLFNFFNAIIELFSFLGILLFCCLLCCLTRSVRFIACLCLFSCCTYTYKYINLFWNIVGELQMLFWWSCWACWWCWFFSCSFLCSCVCPNMPPRDLPCRPTPNFFFLPWHTTSLRTNQPTHACMHPLRSRTHGYACVRVCSCVCVFVAHAVCACMLVFALAGGFVPVLCVYLGVCDCPVCLRMCLHT